MGRAMSKSFLLLFFKKEELPFALMPAPRVARLHLGGD
jgi:hypothetical protein